MKLRDIIKTGLAAYGLCKLTGDFMDRSLDRLLGRMERQIEKLRGERCGGRRYIFDGEFKEVER